MAKNIRNEITKFRMKMEKRIKTNEINNFRSSTYLNSNNNFRDSAEIDLNDLKSSSNAFDMDVIKNNILIDGTKEKQNLSKSSNKGFLYRTHTIRNKFKNPKIIIKNPNKLDKEIDVNFICDGVDTNPLKNSGVKESIKY
jgi:hypothetical protein